MYDILIIGAGPAGLSAAIYGARAKKKVLVLESSSYGGQIINSSIVENYPGIEKCSGFEYATTLYNQAKSLGANIVFDEVIEILDKNTVKTRNEVYRSKTIIIATGLTKRKLGLYGENELIGKGVSYCATCDGAFFKDKVVAVVGSGATAIEDTLYLSNIVKKVYLINRSDKFKADKINVDSVINKGNVEIVYNTNIISLNGEDTLKSITLSDENNLEVSGLFIAIGYIPKSDIFKDIVKIDKKAFIESKDTKTNIDNIFVAGDIRTKDLRQLITAASDGAEAIRYALDYLNNN